MATSVDQNIREMFGAQAVQIAIMQAKIDTLTEQLTAAQAKPKRQSKGK